MDQSIIVEIRYLLLSIAFLTIFVFFYGYVAPLNELVYQISYMEMSNNGMLFYFWMIITFTMTLFRQIKLRFNSDFPNLILIVIGLLLFYFFYISAHNSRSENLTITKDTMVYELKEITMATIIFRFLQLIIGVVIFWSVLKSFKNRQLE
ncbi:MAG: hypothetical protein KA782_03070 [Flavobacterium sp.]|nr:hypothetical protein [Flavobacterium sp.]